VYQFLNLEASFNHASLGGRIVSYMDNNPILALSNPAVISPDMTNHYAFAYVNYLTDINYGATAGVFKLEKIPNPVHVGVLYVDYGSFNGYDLQGNATGDFGAREVAFSLGYAQNITTISGLSVGINLKFVSSQLEIYNSFGGAIDLGFLYKSPDTYSTLGLSVRNLGTQFTTYSGTSEQLPTEVTFGFSRRLVNAPLRFHIGLQNLQFFNIAFPNANRATEDLLTGQAIEEEISFLDHVTRHLSLGVNICPDKKFTPSIGYNFRRASELGIVDQRSFAGFSGGFELQVKKIKFSYAFIRYNRVGASHLFGLLLEFNEHNNK